jgi:hypothetical protein
MVHAINDVDGERGHHHGAGRLRRASTLGLTIGQLG